MNHVCHQWVGAYDMWYMYHFKGTGREDIEWVILRFASLILFRYSGYTITIYFCLHPLLLTGDIRLSIRFNR